MGGQHSCASSSKELSDDTQTCWHSESKQALPGILEDPSVYILRNGARVQVQPTRTLHFARTNTTRYAYAPAHVGLVTEVKRSQAPGWRPL